MARAADHTFARGIMGTIQHAGSEAHMALYCDTLVLYLLVESTLGECNLHREMSEALDEMDPIKMVACKRRFESLPAELKARVLDGDLAQSDEEPTLPDFDTDGEDTDKDRRTA